jgi:hypothetical protein
MPPFMLPPRRVPETPTWITESLERYAEGTAMVSLDREVAFYDPHTDNDDPDRKLPDGLPAAIADLNERTSSFAEAIQWIQSSLTEDEHTQVQVDIEDGGRPDRQWLTCTIVENDRTLRHIRLLRFR